MDKDKIEGAARRPRAHSKRPPARWSATPGCIGDARLQAEGKADQADGRWRRAVGSLRDTHRKACAG